MNEETVQPANNLDEVQEKPAKKWHAKWSKRLMLATIVIVICAIVVVEMGPAFSGGGLKLSVSLSQTTIQPGQEMSIVIDEQNTLSVANNVSSSTNWPLNGYVSSLDPCEDQYPFGVAIFQGYYSSANVSTATPLALYSSSSSVIFCPLMLFISSYGFQPLSDIAAILTPCDPKPCYEYTAEMKVELNVTGYWSGSPATLTNFTLGVYTVVARDEWDASEVLHFVVSE